MMLNMVTLVTATAAPVAVLVSWRWSAAWGGVFLGAVALAVWVVVYPPGVRSVRDTIRGRAGLPPVQRMPRQEKSGRRTIRLVGRWRVVCASWIVLAVLVAMTVCALLAVTDKSRPREVVLTS